MAEGHRPQVRLSCKLISIISISLGLLSQVSAEGAAGGLQITEADLKQYDGTNADGTIYLAINGTVFDVSASPTFYGPGGHYHHFTGKDASRAWVSECWDTEAQLTWRMDGLEAMFMPKYLDEQMEQAADGKADLEGAEAYGYEELAKMAKVMMGKFGKVSEKERLRRRAADGEDAKQSVQNALAHWVQFFAGNEKYPLVGEVVLDQSKPEPPELCEAALKKRPHKGGILDDILSKAGGKGGIFGDPQKGPPGMKQKKPVQDEL